jgi:hypothetical protein
MTDEQTRQLDDGVWWIVGLCLVGAAVLIVLGGILQAFVYPGGTRARVEEIVRFAANATTPLLLLGAAIAFSLVHERARSALVFVEVFAYLIIAGAIYSAFDFLTIHIPSLSSSSESISFALAGYGNGWKGRLAPVLPRLGSAVVAVAIIVVARRLRTANVTVAEPPDPI